MAASPQGSQRLGLHTLIIPGLVCEQRNPGEVVVWASQGPLVIKNTSCQHKRHRERAPSGSGRSPEEGMATLSSVLAWRIPWTGKPGGLQSVGSQESDTTEWWSTHVTTPERVLGRLCPLFHSHPIQCLPACSRQELPEWAMSEAMPVKPLDSYRPGWQLGCNFLRDSKPEPPRSAVPGDLTSETAWLKCFFFFFLLSH